MSQEVIVVVGTIAAGKDTVGKYIADKLNIPVFQISSPLKDICAEEGIEPTRENLIALGTRLAHEHGDGYLAESILRRIPNKAIITGLRQLGQIKVLKDSVDLTVISVDADPRIRFERANGSGKLGEANSVEEFVAREMAENSPPNAQRLFECMKLADYHLTNDGSFDDLYGKLDEIAF